MYRSTGTTAAAGSSVQVVDDEAELDSEAMIKLMQREWNTVDFAGKCKRVS